MNGTETADYCTVKAAWFYSSVILNGTETADWQDGSVASFYSSVILNGTETNNVVGEGNAGFTVVLY